MRIIGILITVLFLASCGSKKTVVTSRPTSKSRQTKVTKTVSKPKQVVEEEVAEEKPVVADIKPLVHVEEPKTYTEITLAYIEKFAPIAVKEMQDYKIPASITLAQGILESGSGKSPLALRSNNHFGIKCHKGWQGKSVTHDDDEIGECFRKYKYPENSYEDHSKFLTSRSRYSKLFKLAITDYQGWAYGLKRAGYATDPRYPKKLIGIIKKYDLTQYDKMALAQNSSETTTTTTSNGAILHEVQKGDTLYSIARKHGISVKKLKEINGLTTNTISIGQELLIY